MKEKPFDSKHNPSIGTSCSPSRGEAVTKVIHYWLRTRIAIGPLRHNERTMPSERVHRTFDYLPLISFGVAFLRPRCDPSEPQAAGCEQVVRVWMRARNSHSFNRAVFGPE